MVGQFHAPQLVKGVRRTLVYGLLFIILGFLFFPVFWMVSTAFKSTSATFAIPPQLIPLQPTVAAFETLAEENLPIYLKNSFIVATITTLLTVVVASLSSYSFTRLRTKTAAALFYLIMTTQMFPAVVLLIPIYLIMQRLQLLNTYAGLIIAYLAFSLPFCVWYLRGYFESIPIELEEAALTDGCNRLQSLVMVIFPLSLPGIVATSFFAFLTAWNEYLMALTLINREEMRTLPPGLVMSYVGEFGYRWPDMMAACLMVSLPVIVLFFVMSRNIVKGLTEGAVK
jgi:multiple sugar transport system permease protein